MNNRMLRNCVAYSNNNGVLSHVEGQNGEGTKMADPTLSLGKLFDVSQVSWEVFSANFIA